MKSVAFIYASGGTRHKQVASALKERFSKKYPDSSVIYVDILDFVPTWVQSFMSNTYERLVQKSPHIWAHLYVDSDKRTLGLSFFKFIHNMMCKRYLPKLEKVLYANNVQAVFFTHYFGAAPLARRNKEKFPVFFVNTAFMSHKIQRSKAFAHSFCASKEDLKQYNEEDIESVSLTGIPIAYKFTNPPTKLTSRAKLGIEEDAKVAMISGGGIGAGKIEDVVKSFIKIEDMHVLVICGRNKELYLKLKSEALAPHIHIYGFVNDIEFFYKASDLAVIKPGGVSISECLALNLPMILINPIPGMEQINQKFVCSKGAAIPLVKSHSTGHVVSDLIEDSFFNNYLIKNMAKLAHSDAADVIIDKAEKIVQNFYTDKKH